MFLPSTAHFSSVLEPFVSFSENLFDTVYIGYWPVMVGYWPSSFFACLWIETEAKSINSRKKNKASLDKDLLFDCRGFILLSS